MRALSLLATVTVGLVFAGCGPSPLPPLLRSEAERQAEATRALHQGMRSLSTGDRETADRHFLQSAYLYGPEQQGFVRVARRLLNEGECDRAGLLLEQASTLPEYRNDPFVFHTLAQASRNKGDVRQAEALEQQAAALVVHAQQVASAATEKERETRIRQLILTGRYAVEVQQQPTTGIVLLRQAVALHQVPRTTLDNIALSALGYALTDHPELADSPREARESTRQAAQAELENAYLRHAYGWALFRSGDSEGALRVLREAVDLDQCDPEIHYHLGLVYQARGDQAQAALELDRALRLSPHYQEAEEARKQLAVKRLAGADNPQRDGGLIGTMKV